MYMLILVLDDSARLNDVLQAWLGVGVQGITILESTGVNRMLLRREASPGFMGFAQLLGSGRVGHNTLFAIVDDLVIADIAHEATEKVVGRLSEPNTGIMFVVPVVKSWGVPDSE